MEMLFCLFVFSKVVGESLLGKAFKHRRKSTEGASQHISEERVFRTKGTADAKAPTQKERMVGVFEEQQGEQCR